MKNTEQDIMDMINKYDKRGKKEAPTHTSIVQKIINFILRKK